MMDGVVKIGELVKSKTYPTVLAAACVAFGFVFVHPFLDGNGRLHRFLLHHLLRLGGFTPAGAIVPVSAAMERDIARYAEVLKHYFAPRTAMLDYRLDSDADFIDVKNQPPYLICVFRCHGTLRIHIRLRLSARSIGIWMMNLRTCAPMTARIDHSPDGLTHRSRSWRNSSGISHKMMATSPRTNGDSSPSLATKTLPARKHKSAQHLPLTGNARA